MMVDVDEVIDFHGVKPKHFGYDKDDTETLCETITLYIKQCEDLIKTYTNNKFPNGVPPAVSNICLRLVSNMITLAVQKRDTPIIKVNDWTIQSISSDIFTEDLKNDLEPFIIDHSNKSDKIDILAITGE